MIATLQEVDVDDEDSIDQHEENFGKTFRNDAMFVELGNPFEETEGGSVNIRNKHIVANVENESVRVAYESGTMQYDI